MVKDNAIEANAVLGNYNRQYVGARYVPKFFENPNGTAEWLGNIPYDALTIVTYLGNSYTSKIPVPPGVGNPSLNPTYWALTGNYNRQVEEYRKDVEEYKQSTNASLNQINTSLSRKMENLRNKKIVLIGDSYTTNFANAGSMFDAFTNPYINPSNVYKRGENGAGATVVGQQGHNFRGLVEALLPSIPDTDEITDFVLIGGYNDITAGSWTYLSGAVSSLWDFVLKTFPNATLYFTLPGNNYELAQRRLNLYEVVLPGYTSGSHGKAIYLDTTNCIHMKNDFTGSGLYHPSATGYAKLNISLWNQFCGGSDKGFLTSLQPSPLLPIVKSGYLNFMFTKNATYLYAQDNFYIQLDEAITFVVGTAAQTTKIILSQEVTSIYRQAYVKIPISINVNNKSYSAYLTINDDNKWILYSFDYELNGVSASQIYFSGFQWSTFPFWA